VRVAGQTGAKALPYDWVIIHDQDTDGPFGASGARLRLAAWIPGSGGSSSFRALVEHGRLERFHRSGKTKLSCRSIIYVHLPCTVGPLEMETIRGAHRFGPG